MLIGGVLFVAFVTLVIVGIVALVTKAVSGLRGASFVVLVPIGLFVLVVFVARRFIRTWRPVRALIGAAGSLADGDYSVRVSPGGSTAVRMVVDSFNDMARRLETADEQRRRRLLADLGHELRTPLTVIRGEIEAILDGVHQPDTENLELLVAEVGVMERLLEDLRTLSLIDAGLLDLHREPTDIDQLLTDVADGYGRRAAETGVVIASRGSLSGRSSSTRCGCARSSPTWSSILSAPCRMAARCASPPVGPEGARSYR